MSLFKEQSKEIQWNDFIGNWIQWDAAHYIRISEGYKSFDINGDYSTLVFFPLYSWLLRFLRLIISSAAVSGLLISSVLSSFACVFMYKLVCIDYSKTTAQTSVILLCLFPFGFFYSAIMTESTFLLTSVLTLYFIRLHKWHFAGICGLLAALSRSAGVFLVFPAAVELLEETKLLGNLKNVKIWGNTVKKGLWLLLLPLGTLIYLFINFQITGDPFYFFEMEEKYWHQVSQPFFKTFSSFWNIITGKGHSISVLMAAFLPGFVCLLSAYAVLLKGLTKHKTMYICWLVIYIIINTTMSWPLSFCRYIACGVPLYIIIADECEKNKKLGMATMISWSILFGVYFTGYLMTKQIM